MLIVDSHLDLAMNAVEWNRDLTLSVKHIRNSESGMNDKPDRGNNTVSLEAMRKGNIGLCVATQIAGCVKGENLQGWSSSHQAWAQTQGQLAWYKAMEELGEMRQITSLDELNNHLELWIQNVDNQAIGYILSLEGADSIIDMQTLENSYRQGLRAIGPAHYGKGIYAHGTNSIGGIGSKGKELLKKIEELDLILDVTHLCDQSFWETINIYNGILWASHNNCRKLVNHERQFSDDQIKELINRESFIGVALDAWMLVPNWKRGVSSPESLNVSLENVVDNIDHICQLSGNSFHVGIGSDLDGAFGNEQCPRDLNTIADLQKIPKILKERGYSKSDIENIMSENFIRFLRNNWK